MANAGPARSCGRLESKPLRQTLALCLAPDQGADGLNIASPPLVASLDAAVDGADGAAGVLTVAGTTAGVTAVDAAATFVAHDEAPLVAEASLVTAGFNPGITGIAAEPATWTGGGMAITPCGMTLGSSLTIWRTSAVFDAAVPAGNC